MINIKKKIIFDNIFFSIYSLFFRYIYMQNLEVGRMISEVGKAYFQGGCDIGIGEEQQKTHFFFRKNSFFLD